MERKTEPVDPESLNEIMWRFAGPVVIATASRLGILSRLSVSPATAEQVAGDLDLDALATGKLVRALCALGILQAQGSTYGLVPQLAGCFDAGPGDLRPYVDHLSYLSRRWSQGLELWARGQERPRPPMTEEQAAQFSAAMVAMGSYVAQRVADALDLEGVNRVLDVGGGYGHYARALCQRSSALSARVLDRPTVADQGRDALAQSDLASRIEFVGGDYLADAYGDGFDLVLLANVLHQEKAANAAEMVGKAAAALSRGGRVAVIDFAIDDERRHHLMGTMFAINMRSFGDTHTEGAIRSWLEDAGLTDIVRTDLSTLRWLITGRKP